MVRKPENLADYVDFAVPKFLMAEDGRYLALVEGRVKAGLGVAMANAVLPVRKAADYVTFSNDEDGVAHVVEKFLL